MLNIDIATL